MKYKNRIKQHFSLIIHTMMQEYNTHTHTHVHMDILLLTVVFASVEAPASSSSLTVSAVPYWAANMSAVLLSWWKYYNYGNTISDIIINITICDINYIPMHKYHIIMYNIKLYKKWLTVIQTKRERKRERIIKRNTNRLRKWRKEKEN